MKRPFLICAAICVLLVSACTAKADKGAQAVFSAPPSIYSSTAYGSAGFELNGVRLRLAKENTMSPKKEKDI